MSDTEGARTSYKRRRVQRTPSPELKLDDDDYQPYIPVAQRKQAKLAKLTSWGAKAEKSKPNEKQEEEDDKDDEEREEERRRERARNERTLLMEAQEVHDKKAAEGASPQLGILQKANLHRCEEDRN